MNKLISTEIAKARERRVNKLLKTIKLSDGRGVKLPKTKEEKVPLPAKRKPSVAF